MDATTGPLLPVPEATSDYHPPPRLRGRAELVAGTRPTPDEDFRKLLRYRLRLFTWAVVIGFTASIVSWMPFQSRALVADPAGWVSIHRIWAYVMVEWVVFCCLAALLWRKPGMGVGGLRSVELGGFAVLVLHAIIETYLVVQYTVSEAAQAFFLLPGFVVLEWFGLIVGYGVIIPNTGRRCLAVAAGLATVGLVSIIGSLVSAGVEGGPLYGATGIVFAWLSYGILLTVATARWGDRSRREAADARMLGQYLLRERLGAGGMGEVYRAEHGLLRRPCAIKLIRPERAADPTALARFEREVQATAALSHPNVVRIFDYGRADDGTFYCVMEYLSGVTLEELVRRHGPLPPDRVVFLLRQLCSALAEAHAAGLTHRDVKPGNVIVRDRGRQADAATLLDFGLVLDRTGGDEKLTAHGAVAGTPAYMAPEQAAGDPVDARADVYAVGAVGYFVLSGGAPFAAGSAMRTIAAVLTEPPKPLGGVPEGLSAVVIRCLAKRPEERYPTADELDAALAGCGCDGWSHARAATWWTGQRPAPPAAADATGTFVGPANPGGSG